MMRGVVRGLLLVIVAVLSFVLLGYVAFSQVVPVTLNGTAVIDTHVPTIVKQDYIEEYVSVSIIVTKNGYIINQTFRPDFLAGLKTCAGFSGKALGSCLNTSVIVPFFYADKKVSETFTPFPCVDVDPADTSKTINTTCLRYAFNTTKVFRYPSVGEAKLLSDLTAILSGVYQPVSGAPSHNTAYDAAKGELLVNLSVAKKDYFVLKIGLGTVTVVASTPANTTYVNSTIPVVYTASGVDRCLIELNGSNMSYPLCSNTTMSYVHFNKTIQLVALDFAEGTGTTTYDKSPHGNNGSLLDSGVTWNTSGKYGTDVSFNTTGSIEIKDHAILNMTANQEFSLAAWFRQSNMTQTSGIRTAVAKHGSAVGQTGYNINYFFNVRNYQCTMDEGAASVAALAHINDTDWHFIVCGRNSTHVFIYADGTLRNATADSTLADLSRPADLCIGGNEDDSSGTCSGSRSNMTAGEFVIYNKSLTPTEVALLYNEHAFNGTHTFKIWANDTNNAFNVSSTAFSIGSLAVNLAIQTPTPTNATIVDNFAYINATVESATNPVFGCVLEWNGANETMTKVGMGTAVSCFVNKTALASTTPYTAKVFANDTIDNRTNSTSRSFSLNSCWPANSAAWNLDLGHNCTITGQDVNVTVWSITATSGGTVTVTHSNISYQNKTLSAIVGDARIIYGAATRLIGRVP